MIGVPLFYAFLQLVNKFEILDVPERSQYQIFRGLADETFDYDRWFETLDEVDTEVDIF